ncbi:Protein of uncharacterised function (DUF1602) [Mycobacteroides abscessus]|nr:Protein of uncharacterised function (DUF1602) [Mycobacteroides abscessus]
MLWLMRMTACPMSRSRWMCVRTSADCATESAAVGSSSTTIRGSPSSVRAIATLWRCPPESVETGTRTDGTRALRSASTRRAVSSMVTSSSPRPRRSSRPR